MVQLDLDRMSKTMIGRHLINFHDITYRKLAFRMIFHGGFEFYTGRN